MKKIFAFLALVGMMFVFVACKDNAPKPVEEEVVVEESCDVPVADTLLVVNPE